MRKLILLAVFALSLVHATAQVTAVQPTGAGTSLSPYLISNLNELYWITQNSSSWDKVFLQTADIDAATLANWPQIGDGSTNFTGTYDGGFRVIRNLTQAGSTVSNFGMFRKVSGTVKNLGLENINYSSSHTSMGASGALMSELQPTTTNASVLNCYVKGSMGLNTIGYGYGGLIGIVSAGAWVAQPPYNNGTVLIEFCYSGVKMNIYGGTYSGGMFGVINGNQGAGTITIRNNYVKSTMIASSEGTTGGLTATTNNGNIVINKNYISTKMNFGANSNRNVMAAWWGGNGTAHTVSQNYYNIDTLSLFKGTGSVNANWGPVTGLTHSQMQSTASFSGWDFVNVWAQNSSFNNGYPYLSVTQQSQLPTVNMTGSMSAFSACAGSASAAQSFTVSGSNLSGAITVTAPTGFEVSNNSSSGYGPSVALSATNNVVAATTLYVRLTSAATGTPSGNIQATSTSAATKNLAVSGNVGALPTAPTVTNGQRCGAGTVALSASVGANTTLRWYASGGTTVLSTSSSYTTPSLSATTSYDVEALSSNGCVSSTKTLATATIVTTPSWSGTGIWTTPSNWTCGSNTVPTGAEDITVASGTLTLDADVVLSGNKTLSVLSGATLVVAPTWALTIESGSTLSNEGTVVVDANSSDYGQLVLKGTYTKVGSGTVTVKRAYDVTGANLNQKWVQMSSPVDASYSSLGSVANNNLLYWDASISNWVSALSTGSAFDGTKGFTAYYGTNGISTTTNGIISLSGSPFTSVSTPTLHNHSGMGQGAFNSFAGSAKSGWNLIGNPFTCNLDFSAFSLANVNASFYRWDAYKGGPGVGGYQAHSAASANPQSTSAVIEPMSAVWVRANGNGSPTLHNGNINVSSHGRRGPKSFKTQPDKFLVTVVDITQPLIADDLSVAMVPGASDAFEDSWDAWELLNSVQMPNMYANFNNEWTTAKAVDFDLNSTVVKVIPVSVKASVEMRPYRIHLDESWAQPGYTVYLKDKLLVNTHKLSTSDYVFAYTSAMEDRFELILTNAKTGALGLEEASRGALTAWVSGSELWITGLESGAQELDVVGMDGRVVLSAQVRAEEGQPVTTSLPELPAGLYTVRVRANGLERGVRFAVQR